MLQWKYWYGLYSGERGRAIKLLEKFELNDIIKALETNEGKVILSLTNDKVPRLAKQAQTQRELMEKTAEKVELTEVTPYTLPRINKGKKSKLGKLR